MKTLFHHLKSDHLYFDCAASPPPLRDVVGAVNDFLNDYGSIHRGHGIYSQKSTSAYESARQTISRWISARKKRDVVIFTGNTTEAINKFVQLYPWQVGDIVLTTDIEHSSNLLPWKKYAKIETIPTNEFFTIDLNALEDRLKHSRKIRIVTLSGAHNVTGQIPDIKALYQLTQRYGVYLFVDCSQLAAHYTPSLDNCDFIAFSGHKMYAPLGAGVLAGRSSILSNTGMASTGGGNVLFANDNEIRYKEAPWCHEPGTPNGVGAIAIAAAIEQMELHADAISQHNREIIHLYQTLFDDDERVFPYNPAIQAGILHTPVLSYRPKYLSQNEFLSRIDGNKISFRAGSFCTYGLMHRLAGKPVSQWPIPQSQQLIRFSAGMCTSANDVYQLREVIAWADQPKLAMSM